MRAIIIHGWGADSTSDWIPWLKQKLEEVGVAASAPDMPNTDKPEMASWVGQIASIVQEPSEDAILIGHSIGCQAIVRYLSSLPPAKSVKCVFLVAPWTKLASLGPGEGDAAKPWMETPIDWKAAKSHSGSFTVFYSDDDAYVPSENAVEFGNNLGAKLILDPKRGHFSDDDDVTQLPELLKEILACNA